MNDMNHHTLHVGVLEAVIITANHMSYFHHLETQGFSHHDALMTVCESCREFFPQRKLVAVKDVKSVKYEYEIMGS